MSAGFQRSGCLGIDLAAEPLGVFHITVTQDSNYVDYIYYGPDDIDLQVT